MYEEHPHLLWIEPDGSLVYSTLGNGEEEFASYRVRCDTGVREELELTEVSIRGAIPWQVRWMGDEVLWVNREAIDNQLGSALQRRRASDYSLVEAVPLGGLAWTTFDADGSVLGYVHTPSADSSCPGGARDGDIRRFASDGTELERAAPAGVGCLNSLVVPLEGGYAVVQVGAADDGYVQSEGVESEWATTPFSSSEYLDRSAAAPFAPGDERLLMWGRRADAVDVALVNARTGAVVWQRVLRDPFYKEVLPALTAVHERFAVFQVSASCYFDPLNPFLSGGCSSDMKAVDLFDGTTVFEEGLASPTAWTGHHLVAACGDVFRWSWVWGGFTDPDTNYFLLEKLDINLDRHPRSCN